MSSPRPVFDYPPYGVPVSFYNDERFNAVMREALANGLTGPEAFDYMTDVEVRLYREDSSLTASLRELYREAGVNLISPTIMSLQSTLEADSMSVPEGIRRDLARWQARFDTLGWMHKCTSPDDARRTVEQEAVGVVLNTQNLGLAIGHDFREIDRLYDFGIRIGQLTYNSQNLLGVGCTERVDGGLSNLGVKAVERMNELGMVVDLSHCGRQTTLDAIETSDRPVVCTHTACQAIADHDRLKSDEELDALAENDGYMGIQVTPPFISPDDPSLAFERFFDHVEHAVSILGIERVGVGTDFGIIPCMRVPEPLRAGFEDRFRKRGFNSEHGIHVGMQFGEMQQFTDWQVIPDGLASAGYSQHEIDRLVGENFLAFWERAVS